MSQESIVISVSPAVARNPITRAIERKRLQQFFTSTSIEMLGTPDGEWARSMIHGVAEAISIAVKSVDGYADPAGVRDQLTDALGVLVEMAEAGFIWCAASGHVLVDALDVAVQILSSADPAEKLRAWKWAQDVNAAEFRAAQERAAA